MVKKAGLNGGGGFVAKRRWIRDAALSCTKDLGGGRSGNGVANKCGLSKMGGRYAKV